jgi:cardiolipin synthase
VTASQAQARTESFVRGSDLTRQDVAIAYAPTTASDVQTFLDGTTFFPAILADIAQARRSVHMQMFGMTEGVIAQQVVDALIERAGQGIEVRLSVDHYGAKVSSQSKPYLDALQAAGVQVVVNNEFPPDRDGLFGTQAIDWRGDEVGESDHHKAMVVDGVIG